MPCVGVQHRSSLLLWMVIESAWVDAVGLNVAMKEQQIDKCCVLPFRLLIGARVHLAEAVIVALLLMSMEVEWCCRCRGVRPRCMAGPVRDNAAL